EVMKADTIRMRGQRPFGFSNLKSGEGVDQIATFIIEKGGLASHSLALQLPACLRETGHRHLIYSVRGIADECRLPRFFRPQDHGKRKPSSGAVSHHGLSGVVGRADSANPARSLGVYDPGRKQCATAAMGLEIVSPVANRNPSRRPALRDAML